MQEWRVRSAVENVLVLSRTVQYNDCCEKRQYLVKRRDQFLSHANRLRIVPLPCMLLVHPRMAQEKSIKILLKEFNSKITNSLLHPCYTVPQYQSQRSTMHLWTLKPLIFNTDWETRLEENEGVES
ncbi:hypothetical protein L5515_017418 [Caenorhabditis briggsae]|uniref:Uncharacterized protein n=1 Tax=Caenorhabditis briggsae TaxID=6238 RepID=A0AAE9FD38_CAEBR|nr:hypothetical protein L5515_017418 [Caenorhabditis briggsae]